MGLRDATRALSFAGEFRERFLSDTNSGGEDREAYAWMLLRSNRMQREMGPHGIIARFREPYVGDFSNYPVVLNMLPRIDQFIRDGALTGRAHDYAEAFDAAFKVRWCAR